jgi:hypothetical protein
MLYENNEVTKPPEGNLLFYYLGFVVANGNI